VRMPHAANRGVIRASLVKNAGGILESNSPIVARQKLQHAVAELAAASIADELIGQPLRWQVRAALGRSAYALGDDDRAAAA
jgi:hypothetical protein